MERVMKQNLDQNGQIILLLNRRGFSTYLFCPGCGHVEKCKFCDLALIFHKDHNTTICHYCGFEKKPQVQCPDCGLGQVKYQGMGTEKLQLEIQSKFPDFIVERMDSDTMKKPGSHKKVFDKFKRGEIHILLGTQMIAKGLDFPNVRLVGIVNADTALSLPDFRSAERTFQLISQVAGRSGRGKEPGKVIVQTTSPHAAVIRFAAEHDYEGFAADELRTRSTAGLPPITRMARIVVRDEKFEVAERDANEIAELGFVVNNHNCLTHGVPR